MLYIINCIILVIGTVKLCITQFDYGTIVKEYTQQSDRKYSIFVLLYNINSSIWDITIV